MTKDHEPGSGHGEADPLVETLGSMVLRADVQDHDPAAGVVSPAHRRSHQGGADAGTRPFRMNSDAMEVRDAPLRPDDRVARQCGALLDREQHRVLVGGVGLLEPDSAHAPKPIESDPVDGQYFLPVRLGDDPGLARWISDSRERALHHVELGVLVVSNSVP